FSGGNFLIGSELWPIPNYESDSRKCQFVALAEGAGFGAGEQAAVPLLACRGPTRQGGGTPDQRKCSSRAVVCLGALRVLHGIRARALGVEEAQQTAEVDRLAGGVEDIGGPGWGEADAKRRLDEVEVHDTDRQPAVQRGGVAGVHG